MRTLHGLLKHIPHRPVCAINVLRAQRVQTCTCDVEPRTMIAYSVISSLLLDLGKGEQ